MSSNGVEISLRVCIVESPSPKDILTLHAEGTPRLSTAVKIGTRTDKDARLEDKLFESS